MEIMETRIALFPNPIASGVPGSGRNWALGAAAYVACWAVWILGVFIGYELIYSFYRRWRYSASRSHSTLHSLLTRTLGRCTKRTSSHAPTLSLFSGLQSCVNDLL